MTAVSEKSLPGRPLTGRPRPRFPCRATRSPGSPRCSTRHHDPAPAVAPTGPARSPARGLIDGSGAVAFASDPRVQGGAMGTDGCAVIVAAYNEAIARGVPMIGLWHSGGAGWPKASRRCTASARSSPR